VRHTGREKHKEARGNVSQNECMIRSMSHMCISTIQGALPVLYSSVCWCAGFFGYKTTGKKTRVYQRLPNGN
jgi:hypothetical protein